MLHNNALQNQALIAWTGAAATPRRVVGHLYFAFCFEVLTTLVADAIFNIKGYAADAANPCAYVNTPLDIKTVGICTAPGAFTPADAVITIPSGTVAGTVITAALPCRTHPFVGLVHVSGGANVRAAMVLSGPTA